MSNLVVLDTSIFIDNLRFGRHQNRLDTLTGIVRTSAMVLAELWRGATKSSERKFLAQLEKNYPLLTPTRENWVESGQLLTLIRSKVACDSAKLRDLHFDVLIALTARSYGARLITLNRSDFELIHRYRPFDLELW